MLNYELLVYWMGERESVRKKKEAGKPKPWSSDPIFQRTYFCNVRREDDKVTRFIRGMYTPHVNHPLFVHNIILSRFLNWPPTLEYIGYQEDWTPDQVKDDLNHLRGDGKVWGNAYVVSTCGRKIEKIDYLTEIVMPSIAENLFPLFDTYSCEAASWQLQTIEGISTFMAGQVVADLKNTPDYPLQKASDWWTFALIGPGSRRGMEWLCGEHVPDRDWHRKLLLLSEMLYTDGWRLCAQDIQNSLCEFDKFCRVKQGTGRSKRNYDGT